MLFRRNDEFYDLVNKKIEDVKNSLDMNQAPRAKSEKSIWVCSFEGCGNSMPVEVKRGKRRFIPPEKCDSCGRRAFKLAREESD